MNEGVEFLNKKAHYHKPDSGITVVFESTLSCVGANQVQKNVHLCELFPLGSELLPARKFRLRHSKYYYI